MTSREASPKRSDANDPEAGRETARLLALLQSLPDPQPPTDLSERVMAEVRRREARPRVLRVAFRIAAEPGAATALAAGLACLAIFAGVRGLGTAPEPRPERLLPTRAHPIGVAEAVFERRPGPMPVIADPVGLFPDRPAANALPTTIAPLIAASDPISRRLDHQLNRLQLDPLGFYAQIERHPNADALIARLADRAAERGDAIGVAMRLRETVPKEPTTSRFVEQLFGSVLERSLPRH